MNIRLVLTALVCLIGAQLAAAPGATADEVIYDGSGFLRGQQSFTDSFAVDGPGTLTVTLTNVAWPDSLASLNLLISTPTRGLLGPEMGSGTETFNVTGESQIFAQWFGTAQGALDVGVYGLKIEFAPAVVSVPLPTSMALLLSGLLLLAWHRRTREWGAPAKK